MKTLFVINPISGKGRKEKILSELRRRGCGVAVTEYAGHAEKIAREADADAVIAVGGDGTVNEVARGLLGTGKALGILPCGSGDGLALCLGISRNVSKALEVIENGELRPLDEGLINGRPFFSVCGTGFDADVSRLFALSGKRGLKTYISKALELWRTFCPEIYTISVDGKEWTQEAVLVTVGNSNQWGNGAKVAPNADCGDGVLDVTVLDMFTTLELPHLAARLMEGRCDSCGRVHCHRGRHIVISRPSHGPAHFDGDWFEAGRTLDISVIPAALKVLAPARADKRPRPMAYDI